MRIAFQAPHGPAKTRQSHEGNACQSSRDHSGVKHPHGAPLLIGWIQDKYLAKNDEGHMARGKIRFTGPAIVAAVPVAGRIQ